MTKVKCEGTFWTVGAGPAAGAAAAAWPAAGGAAAAWPVAGGAAAWPAAGGAAAAALPAAALLCFLVR